VNYRVAVGAQRHKILERIYDTLAGLRQWGEMMNVNKRFGKFAIDFRHQHVTTSTLVSIFSQANGTKSFISFVGGDECCSRFTVDEPLAIDTLASSFSTLFLFCERKRIGDQQFCHFERRRTARQVNGLRELDRPVTRSVLTQCWRRAV